MTEVEGLYRPPLSAGQTAAIATLRNQLEASQWLSAADIHARQLEQLVVLASHCAEQAPVFRERLLRAGMVPGDLGNFDKLQILPIMTRRDTQNAGEGLFCAAIPPEHRFWYPSKSSGSTGEPVAIRRTWINYIDWMAITLRGHKWHERDFLLRHCSIFAGRNEPIRLDKWKAPISLFFDSGPSLSLPVSMDLDQLCNEIKQFRASYLLTYPSVMIGLMDHCIAHDMQFECLKEISLVGEVLAADARKEMSNFFRTPICDMYGAGEVGLIAQQCPSTGLYHINAETVLLEVLDEKNVLCGPGQIGRVVVTDLRNFATPIIRYELGDYAEVAGPCACGRGLPALRQIIGRQRNLLVLPDGRRRWPQLGFGEYRKIAPIRQYQLIQHEVDKIEVRLVVDKQLDQTQQKSLAGVIQTKLGYPFELRFEYFRDSLPVEANGKFEEFKNAM